MLPTVVQPMVTLYQDAKKLLWRTQYRTEGKCRL